MRCCHCRQKSGQSAVEFALVLPVLVVVILGIFDFARAVWHYNTLAEAAREGTRFAMVHGADSPRPVGPAANDPQVRDVVQRFAFALDTSQLTVLSTWPNGTNRPGDPVRVEVRYTYIPLTGLIVGGGGISLISISEASIVY